MTKSELLALVKTDPEIRAAVLALVREELVRGQGRLLLTDLKPRRETVDAVSRTRIGEGKPVVPTVTGPA